MKNFLLVGKIVSLSVIGILSILAILLFPGLITSNDGSTVILGYSYVGILLVFISIIVTVVRKENRPSDIQVRKFRNLN